MSDKTALSKLPPASFDGQKFVAEEVRVKGALRHHVHEFIKLAGGQPEKNERHLYTISMKVAMHEHFEGSGKDGFPYGIDKLLRKFEKGLTATLVVPGLGAIEAFCTNWSTVLAARVRSGVSAELEFLEDREELTFDELLDLRATSLESAAAGLEVALATFDVEAASRLAQGLDVEIKPPLLDQVFSAVRLIEGLGDQVDLYSNLFTSTLDGLLAMFKLLDKDPLFQNTANFDTTKALLDLWIATQQLQDDVAGKALVVRTITLDKAMSAAALSARLYGDVSHAVELMQLNATIEDAFEIKAGTKIRYVPVDA